MILLDANLLICAVNEEAPLHRRAKRWLQETMEGAETVGLSWSVLLAFLRVTTRPGLFRHPMPLQEAFRLVDSLLSQPVVTLINPGPRHLRSLQELLGPLGTAGNLVPDAHLAALAIEHGALLCSTDSDFARFSGLHWHNPLA